MSNQVDADDVRNGSLADLNANVTPMAASGGKPAVRSAIFENPAPDVCFHPKQPFRSAKIQENDRLLVSPAPVWWTPLNVRDNA